MHRKGGKLINLRNNKHTVQYGRTVSHLAMLTCVLLLLATICHSYMPSPSHIYCMRFLSFSITKILPAMPCRRYIFFATVQRSCAFFLAWTKGKDREREREVGLGAVGRINKPLPPLLLWNGRLKRWEVTDRLSGSCSARICMALRMRKREKLEMLGASWWENKNGEETREKEKKRWSYVMLWWKKGGGRGEPITITRGG